MTAPETAASGMKADGQRSVLREYLARHLEVRTPRNRSLGVKTLNLGIEEDPLPPERFFVASERAAVVPIPSLTSHEAFDSGVLLGTGPASRLLDHSRQAYAALAASKRWPTCRRWMCCESGGGMILLC
ncbi:hypothetical protein [Micromonospora humida]|uniref:Uncharacterized protein n=1 Tax=Micromonospora humida TaxID=2809018 RepID=A0ABS2IMB6_9ACTN|nr:hypothetical protein [Micromonospora humida]MBM7075497.1 hypothetical protein [Micromonospora humida]